MGKTFMRIEYKYETSTEQNDPDRPEPLIIQVDDFDASFVQEVTAYLIANVSLVYNLDGIDTHLGARPVLIELMGSIKISERAFWIIVLKSHPDPISQIEGYVDAHIAHKEKGAEHKYFELDFCSYLDVVSQEGIYAFLDSNNAVLTGWASDEEAKGTKENILRVTDCFLKFLKCCDLDHEVFQDGYIQKLLHYLKYKDKNRFLDLLIYRLFNGQHGVSNTTYSILAASLHYPGGLRDVIDRLLFLKEEEGYTNGEDDVLHLCAVVYGTRNELITEVLNYCRGKIEIYEGKIEDKLSPKQLKYQLLRDIDINLRSKLAIRSNRKVNTGFHEYSPEDDNWKWMVEP